jgi:hypothetical protein
MTYGPQATLTIDTALWQYDAALAGAGVTPCGPHQLTCWLEIHHILTAAHTSAATATGTPGIKCAKESPTGSEPRGRLARGQP